VLRDVQAFNFFFFAGAEAGQQIGDFKNYDGADQRKSQAISTPINWLAT
jgi:hypothetical protein